MPEDMHLGPDGRVELDPPEPVDPETRVMAIVHCGLCDDDGYHGSVVCDHIDHRPAAERGMAKVRAALEKGGKP